MDGNSLSNKDVSNRVSQADDKAGIVVYTSSTHHLCCALLPGSTDPLGESGVIDLHLPLGAARSFAMQALKYSGSMPEQLKPYHTFPVRVICSKLAQCSE